jgi:hypothetical protein
MNSSLGSNNIALYPRECLQIRKRGTLGNRPTYIEIISVCVTSFINSRNISDIRLFVTATHS